MSGSYNIVNEAEMNKHDANGRGTNYFLYAVACAVNVASFSVGIAFAWSSPTIPLLNGSADPQNNPLAKPITPFEESWIAALLTLGAASGPFVFGYVVDKFGRKTTLLIGILPLASSFVVNAFAAHVCYFYFARFLGGVGIGALFTVLPIYIGEIAEDANRGALGCFMPVFITIGNVFSFSVGPYLTVMWFNLISVLPSILFFVLVWLFVPDSPHYYITKANKREAANSLSKLRISSPGDLEEELKDVQKYVEDSFANKGKFRDILHTRSLKRGFIAIIGLMVLQQFSGINVVLCYMQSIFESTGSALPADISSIIISIVQLIACGSTPLVIERLGRRFLLLISAVGSCVAQASMGAYFYMKQHDSDISHIQWLPVLSLVLFMVAYNLGFGPLPWAMLGEIFPPNMKSIASTTSTTICFFLAFFTTMVSPYFMLYVGMAETFMFFACCCAFGGVYIFLFVPETKGKSLHEIQLMLDKET